MASTPERTPIEANLWGTSKSSGSFAGLFRSRLLRAIQYRNAPTELKGAANGAGTVVCSPEFNGALRQWKKSGSYTSRAIYLSCGNSATTGLAACTIDLVLTDPPFFDNVHYSELADFFYAWQQLEPRGFIKDMASTRAEGEVQDTDAERFAEKLTAVFTECHRVLKDEGLLVFTYHHSREEGWTAVAEAVLGAGFTIVNAHPLKAEMSVATPKAQAKEPIQLDIAIVCRKASTASREKYTRETAVAAALEKLSRLEEAGFTLSRNDQKTVLFGQLLTTLHSATDLRDVSGAVERAQNGLPRSRAKDPESPRVRHRPTRGATGRHEAQVQLSLFK